MKKEYILCAAIHYDDGTKRVHQPKNIGTGIVVAGRRHHNCIITVAELMGKNWKKDHLPLEKNSIQGFITSHNRFLNRQEAWTLAIESGQIEADEKENTLFSEDLY